MAKLFDHYFHIHYMIVGDVVVECSLCILLIDWFVSSTILVHIWSDLFENKPFLKEKKINFSIWITNSKSLNSIREEIKKKNTHFAPKGNSRTTSISWFILKWWRKKCMEQYFIVHRYMSLHTLWSHHSLKCWARTVRSFQCVIETIHFGIFIWFKLNGMEPSSVAKPVIIIRFFVMMANKYTWFRVARSYEMNQLIIDSYKMSYVALPFVCFRFFDHRQWGEE